MVATSAAAAQTPTAQAPTGQTLTAQTLTAQTPTQTPTAEAARSNAAPLEDTGCVSRDVERTNALFAAATTAWERGDTAGAVSALREAYGLSSCSAFLFVLGEMLRQSDDECDAVVWYERYLVDNAAVQKRAIASARLNELRASCPPSPPAATERARIDGAPGGSADAAQLSPAKSEQASRYWTTARIGGFASLGVSALLGTGAVYFAVRAHNASNDYEQLWRSAAEGPTQVAEWQQGHAELEQRGSSSATTARLLGGAAGALAVGGALLLLFNPGGNDAHDVALSAGPTQVVARYGARF